LDYLHVVECEYKVCHILAIDDVLGRLGSTFYLNTVYCIM